MERNEFIKLLINGYFMQTINGKNIYYYSDGLFWVNDETTDRLFNPNDISMLKDYAKLSESEFLNLRSM